MALNYLTIIYNSIFAGVLAVVITQALFFLIARIFNYDFVFPVETGRTFLNISADFYSDMYAGIRGFLLHIGIGLIIMFFYSLVFVHLIGIIFNMGPFTYETPQGTAFRENIFWFLVLGLLIYLSYYVRDQNLDKFSVFLFLYLMTLITLMSLIFGLYLFGQPGVIR